MPLELDGLPATNAMNRYRQRLFRWHCANAEFAGSLYPAALVERAATLLDPKNADVTEAEIIEVLKAISGERDRASPTEPETLTGKEFDVLCVLQEEKPVRVVLVNLATKARIGQKTCGQIVNSLIERGLAYRRSERTGVTITPEGETLLANGRPLDAR